MSTDNKWKGIAKGLAFSLVFSFFLLEISARIFWAVWQDVPFFRSGEIRTAMHYAYYPGLKDVHQASIVRGDDEFDVLILGGSVVNEWYGDFESTLRERLEPVVGATVVTHNVSFPGHTTRDSYNKYRLLSDHEFDLVVLYHGINEIVGNVIAAEHFKDDYSHFMWNRGYNALTGNPSITAPVFAAPYTARFAIHKIMERLPMPGTIPIKNAERTRRGFHHGADVKTVRPFRMNVDSIVTIAQRRNDPVLLMSFAYHVAEGYTLDRFLNKELDYGTHHGPIELWGTPENVEKALELHNEVIYSLADHHGTWFVDQRAQMPVGAEYFDDICHMSDAGIDAFVNNIMTVLAPRLVSSD